MNLLKPRGVYRDSCLAMPAIHALAEGYDVFIVGDARAASRRKPTIWPCAAWFLRAFHSPE